MIHGSTLMLVALTTLTPAQFPQAVPGYHAPVVVGQPFYALPAPLQGPGGPVAVPAACAPGCGVCAPSHSSASGWNLGEKCQKIWNWLTYKAVYKTPCCFKPCEGYRPPLYEWFPKCVDGHPTPMPCLPATSHCPSCLHLQPRFGPPTR